MKVPLIAVGIAGLATIAALFVVIDRGGAIAWVALVAGVGLLVKIWRRPAARDWALGLGLATVPVLVWVVTLNYVIATYESGEVIELVIPTDAGLHTARLWVMDIDAKPTVYYDAPPQVAAALLAGKSVQLIRSQASSRRIPVAHRLGALPQAQADQTLTAMQNKYGDRNDAAILFYALLGSPRDRVPMVVTLEHE